MTVMCLQVQMDFSVNDMNALRSPITKTHPTPRCTVWDADPLADSAKDYSYSESIQKVLGWKAAGVGTFKRFRILSKGETGGKTKRWGEIIPQTLNDSELMKRYRLDCAGIMFVVDLIRDSLTSPTQHINAIMPEMKMIIATRRYLAAGKMQQCSTDVCRNLWSADWSHTTKNNDVSAWDTLHCITETESRTIYFSQ